VVLLGAALVGLGSGCNRALFALVDGPG